MMMIPYEKAPYFSMDVRPDRDLTALLTKLFAETPVGVAIETGTHLGTGSTRIFCEAFVASKNVPALFYTIECNRGFWETARRNLEQFEFVLPLWGLSVGREQALDFLEDDEAVNHPERFAGVYADSYPNLFGGYAGELDRVPESVHPDWRGENLLRQLIDTTRTSHLFLALDSAGGIGWLEWQVLDRLTRSRDYLLFLDDVEHIKHFRSLAEMKRRSGEFEILLQKDGWVVARHAGVRA